MGWKEKVVSVFRRGHPDIHEAVKLYAEEHGIAQTDVIGAAVTAYLSSDDVEGKALLEKTLGDRRKGGGGGKPDMVAVAEMFTDMTKGMTSLFTSVNELRSSVSIGAIVSDFKTVTGAVEEIKSMGGQSGTGSVDDRLADAFVEGIVRRIAGGEYPVKRRKPDKPAGEVDEIEE